MRIKHLIFFASIISLFSCSENSIVLHGEINQNMLRVLEEQNSSGRKITVDSAGGKVEAALKIADNILQNNNEVIIENKCISACAEYILPAAKKLVFKDNPIVGFHWNPRMDWALFLDNGGDLEGCDLETYFDEQNFLSKVDINNDFWRLTLKKMELKSYKLEPFISGKCQSDSRQFLNRLWLPTSQDLRTQYGITFEGAVCADNYQICSEFIFGKWNPDDRIVIGDKVYVHP